MPRSIELESAQDGAPLLRIEVDPDVVAKVVSDWTGIPLGKMLQDEADSVVSFEENLKQADQGAGRGDRRDRRRAPGVQGGARRSASADGGFPVRGAQRRGEDRDRARGGRPPLRRGPVHGHDQHERVPGEAHGQPADRLPARLRRVRGGRGAHRGRAAAALLRRPARRGREGRPRRDEPLLPGLRQGDALRRRGARHRLQEHGALPDQQPGDRRDHPAVRERHPPAARHGDRPRSARSSATTSSRRCWRA